MKMFMLMRRFLILGALGLFMFGGLPSLAAGRGMASADADSLDFLTLLMQKELDKNFKRFADSSQVPYYMSFRVNDVASLELSANFGALSGVSHDRNIYFVPQIRIGDVDFDNFMELQNGAPSNMQNPPAAVLLPLNFEQVPEMVGDIVRKELDSRYAFARRALDAARAKVAAGNALRDTAGAFSAAPVARYYEGVGGVGGVGDGCVGGVGGVGGVGDCVGDCDSEGDCEDDCVGGFNGFDDEVVSVWSERVARLSRLFLNNKDVVNSSVSFKYEFRRVLFLSSEGSLVAENRPYIMLSVSAYGIAEDGMSLPLHKNYFAFSLDELPDQEVLVADVERLSAKISELVLAPVVQAYSGPALLSGAAAGVFFHEIFGHRIEGQRLKSDFDGQTFKHMTGQRVLPDLLSVVDDPSLRYFRGEPLYGHYKFDDQGVRGERTVVVEDGVLRNFLMTRTPINGHSRSNGHARADFVNDPTSRQSNLLISSAEELGDGEMLDLLREQIVDEGKEFGFYFREVTGGLTQISSMAVNSFNVYPLEVYRVYADGRDMELVRGVDLIGTPLSMFSNILRAGGTYEVFTGLCGASSGGIP
ncbi:MAG: TldD/PmbA family protein, partial [Bacteroidia bacterium]|nr:TldD/PmbA family protein [Bacteroidia bacterium]